MFQNQNNVGSNATTGVTPMDTQQQSLSYNGIQQQQQQQQPSQQQTSKNVRKKPYVRITEQPAGKALRFRYECEGRSAGSIPGVNSTPENKTYPTIEVVGYKGRVVVVVSCVTKDSPYRPHPHNLVGKEGCKKGVCTLEINSETMRAVFSNLGIQCVKKKDIEAALKAREEIRVDPFKTGFSHRFQPSSIDLNAVRLCFQVFMESEKGRFTQALQPVVSEPIYDKKAMSDLVICRLCSCSASVLGGTQIILLCEKVAKEDIAVRFFEEKNGQSVWESYGDFQHTDVHKQTAITFKTPRYHTLDITDPAKVFIQLRRPSDGVTSEALPFEYVPLDSGRHTFWNLHRHLKRKPDEDIFQQILSVDRVAAKREAPTIEIIDLNTPTLEQPVQSFEPAIATPVAEPTMDVTDEATTVIVQTIEANNDAEAVANAERLRTEQEKEIDTIIDEKVREFEQLEQQQQQQQQQQQEQQQQEQLQQQQQQQQQQQEQQQQEQQQQELQQEQQQEKEEDQEFLALEPHALTPNDKITEWMKSNDLQQPHEQSPSGDPMLASVQLEAKAEPAPTAEDKALNELLDQVAELDEIYTDFVLRRDNYNMAVRKELESLDKTEATRPQMEVDDSFDDTATYTSLQIAFKNPVLIPMDDIMPPTPPMSQCAPEDAQHYDPIEVNSQQMQAHPQSMTQVHSQEQVAVQAPPRPPHHQQILHHSSPIMHVTAAEEEKLPPLPPKRIRKQDSNAENRSIEANNAHTQSQSNIDTVDRKSRNILITKPETSPLNKRLPPKPTNYNTLPKQKKPGFFSKIFSRRKSKSELNQENENNSPATSKLNSIGTSPSGSREPSIGHFQMNDPLRSSLRSSKSLQPNRSVNSSPVKQSNSKKALKTGKPCGRSVSSVSGKRPAHLNADVVHIPLKGDSVNSLPQQQNEAYSNASTITLGGALDRRTVSALQLAEIPISEGGMELVAIADRQSLRNLVSSIEGEFNVQIDPNLDLTEAEHFALYTSVPPQATANPAHLRRKRQKTGGDPMHLLLQQQQKQQQQNDHQDGRQANINCWNAPNIPSIKTEPRDTSPQPFGLYRAQPELTPSPQPLSPASNYNQNSTPSPYNMAAAAAAVTGAPAATATTIPNAQLISPNHQQQTPYGGGGATGVGNLEQLNNNYNPFLQQALAHHQQQQQQQQQAQQHQQQQQHQALQHGQFQGNPFVGNDPATHWESKVSAIAVAAAAAVSVPAVGNTNNLSNLSNPFNMHNLLATGAGGAINGNNLHWNLTTNHLHNQQTLHHQQQQHHLQQQQQQQQQQQHQYGNATNNIDAAGHNVANNTNNNTNNDNNNVNGNNENGPTISNLLSFDSEQLVRINSEDQQMLRLNSEDLQISNLSIST